jgi:hypothetical protein
MVVFPTRWIEIRPHRCCFNRNTTETTISGAMNRPFRPDSTILSWALPAQGVSELEKCVISRTKKSAKIAGGEGEKASWFDP